MERNIALVTGAAGGMGREFAELLARDQFDLVLVDRAKEQLENAAESLQQQYGIQAHSISKDLAKPNAVLEVVEEIDDQGFKIHTLINNAGFGFNCAVADMKIETMQAMMTVNMCVLTEFSRRLLPRMIERKEGRILNMASTSAYQPGPLMAIYFASKAYVLSFTEALHEELRGTGVTVTALCPGPTISSFADTAALKKSPIHNGTIPLWTAKDSVAKGYEALKRGKRVYIVGKLNAVMAHLARFSPNSAVMRVIKRLHQN